MDYPPTKKARLLTLAVLLLELLIEILKYLEQSS